MQRTAGQLYWKFIFIHLLVIGMTNFAYAGGFGICGQLYKSSKASSFQTQFEATFRRSMELLSERFPDFREEDLQQEWDLSGGNSMNSYTLTYLGKIVGQATFKFNPPETLIFDIAIEKKFQGMKLYFVFLNRLLAKHPEVKKMPNEMIWDTEQRGNIDVFLKNLFPRKKDIGMYRTKNIFELQPEIIISLRNRILKAFAEMPSSKARIQAGFVRVEKVAFNMINGELGFSMALGQPSVNAPPTVVIKAGTAHFDIYKQEVYILNANGTVKKGSLDDLSIEGTSELGY